MKKFTFLIMLLSCTLAKAAQKNIEISSLGNGGSNATVTTEGDVTSVTFPTGWSDMAQWWLEADCSAYEVVHLKFTSFTTESSDYPKIKVTIGYGDSTSEDTYIAVTDGTAEGDITLDSEKKSSVEKIYFQPSVASTFTVSEAYFYREAPTFEAATIDVSSGAIGESAIQGYDDEVSVTLTITYDETVQSWGQAGTISTYGGTKVADLYYVDGSTTSTTTYTIAELQEFMDKDEGSDNKGLSISLWHDTYATLASTATLSINAVTITTGASGYATLMLPFAASVPENTTVYTATTNAEGTAVELEAVESIAANQPYIIKGDASTDYSFFGTASADDYSYINGSLTGTYEDSYDVTSGYVLYEDNDKTIGFYPAGDDVNIKKYHAYLPIVSEAKALRLILPEDVTAIAAAKSAAATVVARYNVNGTRLAAPQKGINIERLSDGTTRKVIVK